eukprot:11998141-Ditylum_brightwellii.AAC.1
MGLVSQEKRDSLQLSSIKIVVHDTNASSVPSSGLDSTGLEIPSASSGLRGRYEGKTFETLSLEEEDGFEMTKHHNMDEDEGEQEQEDADNASSNFVIDVEDDEEDDDDHDHKDQGASDIASSPANGTTSMTSSFLVTVEKSRGRPCIKTLLDEGLMSQHQSVSKEVFSCGPTPMMNIVLDIVHGMSRVCFDGCAVCGDVTLYEETFEM